MPILDIGIVTSDSYKAYPVDLTQSLVDEVARVFKTLQGTIWGKVHFIPPGQYAEDHGTPLGLYPVFVTAIKSGIPKGGVLIDEITKLTQVIAKALNHPDTNIHIIYQPDCGGRIAFGGKVFS